MLKKLFLMAALLASGLAYAANPSTNLSVQVVPAGSGGGGLPGSILPPCPGGCTWINDLDEHFAGDSLNTSFWTAEVGQTGGGETSHCSTSNGTMVFDHPGLSLYAWPYDPAQKYPASGCEIRSPYYQPTAFTTPGYFEIKYQADTAFGTDSAWWLFTGPTVNCAGGPNVNGIEIDPAEGFGGHVPSQGIFTNGYGSCITHTVGGTGFDAGNTFHVQGIDWEPGYIATYVDGTRMSYFDTTIAALSGGFEPTGSACPPNTSGTCNPATNTWWTTMFITEQSDSNWSGTTNGLHIQWVRHYHH